MSNDETTTTTGLIFRGDRVRGFNATCEKCGSGNVTIEYTFRYYGGMTGWDQDLSVECRDCQQYVALVI